MSESDPIDLSQLQNLQFGPTWAERLASSESAPGEVIWGRAPDSRPPRDDRGPRRDSDGRPGGRGPGGGFDRRGDNRGPRPDFRGAPGGGPGGDNRGPRRADGPPRGERRDGPRPAGGDNRGPRPAGAGENRGPRPEFRGGPGGDRRDGPPRGEQRGGGERRDFAGRGRGGEGGRFDRDRRDDRREGPPPPLAGWEAKLLPEPRSVEAIARQIKASGRAFSVFDVGRLFMGSRERYLVQFAREKSHPAPAPKQGQPQQQPAAPPRPRGPEAVYQCAADRSLWLSREEAIRHILNSPAITKYYRTETVTIDAPKGNWSAVAVCGFSGALLGPPNHHDFQRNVARLHRERFSDMPLDRYKSRIRTEKDEALLAKWQEDQSSAIQFVPVTAEPLAEGAEAPAPLKSQAEMEAHFLRTHAADAVAEVTTATVPGNIHAKSLTPPLFSLLRREVEHQQRFPMGLVQDLCRELEGRGLRFFKRDKKATFVVRTRPHFLPDDLVLSDRIRCIVEMVRANPGINYTRLVATLAPHVAVEPAATPAPEAAAPEPVAEAAPEATAVAPEAPAATEPAAEAPAEIPAAEQPAPPAAETPVEDVAPAEADAAPAVEDAPAEEAPASETPAAPEAVAEEAAAPPPIAAPEAPAAPILTPEEISILQDLRWLVNEGYVTEFAEGELYVLGRPPQPVPEKRERLPRQKPPARAPEAGAETTEPARAPEAVAEAADTAAGQPEAEAAAAEVPAEPAASDEPAPPADAPAPAPSPAPSAETPSE